MTFNLFGGKCAPAILDIRPAVEPGVVLLHPAAPDLVRLFALDRLPLGRRRPVCRWHCVEGRLACISEPAVEAQR
jgi:hypothetical protein